MLQGLGLLHHSSNSLVSNNFAMIGPDQGELAQGAAWEDMAGLVELDQEGAQIVLHYSMWFMAHLRAGPWAQENVSGKSFD